MFEDVEAVIGVESAAYHIQSCFVGKMKRHEASIGDPSGPALGAFSFFRRERSRRTNERMCHRWVPCVGSGDNAREPGRGSVRLVQDVRGWN